MDWATRRATVSVGPPAANGTTIVMVLAGYSCACAKAPPNNASKAAECKNLIFMSVSSLYFSFLKVSNNESMFNLPAQ